MVCNGKRWHIVLFALLAVLVAMAMAPTRAYATVGWKNFGGKWYHYNKKGVMQTGWYEEKETSDDGSYHWSEWYYLGKNGAAVTGWQKINGTWYYFDEDTDNPPFMYRDIRTPIGEDEYYFAPSGALMTGWIEESWVETGEKITFWYYAKPSGALVTGWLKSGGKWYYFSEDHIMVAGRTEYIDGKWYGFKTSGVLATGWFSEISYGKKRTTLWYYMNSSGVAQRGWQKIGGSWYYFEKNKDSAPIMYSNGLYKIGGKYYYFNKGGDMATGWKKISGKYYYFNPSDGAMVRSRWVGNYYLKANGVMATYEWVDGGKYHVNKDGVYDKKR